MFSRKLVAILTVIALVSGSLVLLATSAFADSAPPLSVNDVTALRPTSGTANFVFTVTLEYPSNNPVNVNYYTTDGTARSTFDYQATNGVVTFAPGAVTKTVAVPVNGTTLHTGDRYFYLNINNPVNAVVVDSYGVGLIQDSSPNPYLNVADATVMQGDGVSNTAAFAVSLTSASANTVRVKYTTSNNSARAGFDYTAKSDTLTFAPGSTSAAINVPILATSTYAATRTFLVTLSNPVNATMSRNQATGSILNDNHTAYVTVDDPAVKKPASGTITMNFPVRLTTVSTFPVTVNYATSDNSAVAPTDYTANVGTVTIPAGTTQVLVPVTVKGNATAGNKNMFLSISSPSAGSSLFLRTYGTGTIVGPAAYSQFTIADVGKVAPNAGSTTLSLTISLTPASASATTVHWATSDGTALAGTNYTATSGTASFAAGVTTQTITVTVLASNTTFNDRYFQVNLSAPTGGAVIERSVGYGNILTHSVAPLISITPIATPQPTTGTATATFTATLTPSSLNTVTVNYATADGTAVAGTDYNAKSATLTFAPGDTSKNFGVTVTANTTYFGADRYFYVNLSAPSNAAIVTNQAYTYLVNSNKAPTLSVNNIAVYKPLTGTTPAVFSVTLTPASVNTVTVHYATSDGNGVAGTDYTAVTGNLTFAPGVVKQTVSVNVLGGTVTTGNRYFYLSISTPTNALVQSTSGQANIVDDTITPYMSINSTTVTRPATGTALATFNVKLSSPSANTVTAHYQTNDSSAAAGLDYNGTSGTVTFAPGVTSQNIPVTVLARTVKTGDKAFYVQLSLPTNALLTGQYYNYAYILDPNINPGLSVKDVSINRPTSGTATETFTVTLDPASANTVTVNYATSNGSAAAGTDYSAKSGVLTFAPGVTTQTVGVTITGIATSTPNRSYFLNLSAATNAQLNRSYGIGMIIDTVAPVVGTSYLSVSDSTVLKPSSGSVNESFTISLLPAATVPVTVSYNTSDYNAVADADYTSTRGTVTFTAGQTSKTVTVAVAGDTFPGTDRGFYLNLYGNTAPSSVLRANGFGLIILNQLTSRVSAGTDVAVIKGDSGTQTATFTVTLSSAQAFPVQVDYATANGSAAEPESYVADSGTLTFTPGQTTKTVAITVNSNTLLLATQYFALNLSNPVNTIVGSPTAYGFIYNADVFTITGSVVGPTGAPVAGATVTRTGNNQPNKAVTTAANGTFTIPNTLGGSYKLTPTHGGQSFLPAFQNVTVLGANLGGQNFLEYTAGPTSVTGKIANPKAIGGVTVTRTGGAQPTATATTTSLGYYAFVGLPVGNGYVFTPTLATWTFAPASFTVNINGTTTVAPLDFVGVQAPFITGRVTHAGAGVPGVTITRTGGGAPTATVVTNSKGYYGFSAVPATAGGVVYTLTPTLAGQTFTPGVLGATVSTTVNASGEDFVEN